MSRLYRISVCCRLWTLAYGTWWFVSKSRGDWNNCRYVDTLVQKDKSMVLRSSGIVISLSTTEIVVILWESPSWISSYNFYTWTWGRINVSRSRCWTCNLFNCETRGENIPYIIKLVLIEKKVKRRNIRWAALSLKNRSSFIDHAFSRIFIPSSSVELTVSRSRVSKSWSFLNLE